MSMLMQKTPKFKSSPSIAQEKNAKIIMIVVLLLWIISLALTGFAQGNNGTRGWFILITGFLSGFTNFTWFTVYSNLPLIYALFKFLVLKKVPKYSILIMMPLASILIYDFFVDVPMWMNENGGSALVQSWGWGAILLLVCQALLVIATLLLHHKITIKISCYLITILVGLVIGVGYYGDQQRQLANQWEYETFFAPKGEINIDTFLPFEVAFTKVKLTGYPYIPLTQPISSNATVEMIVATNLPQVLKKNSYLYPSHFWQNGKYWQQKPIYHDNLWVRNETIEQPKTEGLAQPIYQLKVTQPQKGLYLYTLTDLKNGKTLYQQPFLPENEKYQTGFVSPHVNWLPKAIYDWGQEPSE